MVPETQWAEVERYDLPGSRARVIIRRSPDGGEGFCEVVEPPLSPLEHEVLERLYEDLQVLLAQVEFPETRSPEEVLRDLTDKLMADYRAPLEAESGERVLYYLRRDILGYERIDPLMRDPNIEDVACNGPGQPVFVYHRKHQNLKTNITLDEDVLDGFVARLAQRSGRHISLGQPLLNATLPDGSRIHASYAREVTTRGTTFTIRRFRAEPFTPAELLSLGTLSAEMLAYLWLLVEEGKNGIVAGATAAGKTTTLNALSLFIPAPVRIITIEDTRELQLHHENWVSNVTRDSPAGGVDMQELLRQALRQRPEYLIVGEVRGAEAMALFQAMATGHSTLSTLHSASIAEVIARLANPPMSIPAMMLQSLGFVAVQVLTHRGGKRLRRIASITELAGLDMGTLDVRVNEVFQWNPATDTFRQAGESLLLQGVMTRRGWDHEELEAELDRRARFLRLASRRSGSLVIFRDLLRAYRSDPQAALWSLREAEMESLVSKTSTPGRRTADSDPAPIQP